MAKEGKVPRGYQVHHRIPLDDGGTNSRDNFILIRNDVEHRALHGYYNPAELRIRLLAYGEKLGRQSEIMTGYLDSDAPLANGSHWLSDWRSSVRTAANKEELIREYAGTITLNGTGHSWCVGNAKGTGCGGLCVFEAQMCVDCNYGIIGPEHRPVWEGILEQQRQALALDDMGPGGRARSQQIIGYAEKVLHRLDGQEVVA